MKPKESVMMSSWRQRLVLAVASTAMVSAISPIAAAQDGANLPALAVAATPRVIPRELAAGATVEVRLPGDRKSVV